MIRHFASVVLAVTALGSGAWAEPVRVQTGEHDNFSRVVLQFARPTAWTVGRTSLGYGLRLGRSDVDLDLSGAFDLIPRTRITSMAVGPGDLALQIQTDCDCHVQAFEDRPGILVIDVYDGPPPPLSRFETALAEPARPVAPTRAAASLLARPQADPQSPAGLLPLYWRRTFDPNAAPPVESAESKPGMPESPRPDGIASPATALARQAPAADMQRLPDVAMAARGPVTLPDVVPAMVPDVVAEAETHTAAPVATAVPDPTFQLRPNSSRIDSARDILLKELSRAANQGLLEVVQAERPILPTAPAVAEPALLPEPEAEPAPTDHVSIKAETSIDRDALLEPASRSVTPDGVTCISDELLAVPEWGDDRPPAEQISERRLALVGEFDEATVETISAMAHLYLYLGFGAEAQETLRAFPTEVPDSDLIRILGSMMDGGTPDPGRLQAMTDCDGAAALWAVLAAPQLIPGQPVDRKAVVRSFSALPLHLRRLLGPRLSNKFLSLGDEATARTIQGAVTRAAGDPGAEARLVDAKLDLTRNETVSATTTLAAVVAEDGDASPEALILLIESQIEEGTTVDSATVDTAAAMAFEHRGTALGTQLARIEVLATAASGNFDGAFATLAVQTGVGPEAMPTELDEDLFGLLEDKADDATFLRHMFGATDQLVEADLSRGLRQRLADRMVTLGFPDQAKAVLAAAPSPKAADRLLLARIALASSDSGEALRVIEGMEGPDAELIRAEALSALGYDAAASGAFRAAGDTARAASASWQAGDLATAGELGSPEQRAAISAVAPAISPEETRGSEAGAADPALEKPDAEQLGPLARNRALLADSEATRASLEQLLAAFPPAAAAPEVVAP